MGRKQKLRQEKRNIKNKAAAAEVTAAAVATAAAEVTAAAVAVATTNSTKDVSFSNGNEIDRLEGAPNKEQLVGWISERVLALQDQLPESDMYDQAAVINISYEEQYEFFKRGITEDECVHSMQAMGEIFYGQWELTMNSMQANMGELKRFKDKKRIHLALPWYLEAAIRGSVLSTRHLMGRFYILNAAALMDYWGEIYKKYYSERGFALVEHQDVKDLVERECVMCSKTDTETFTRQPQCQGCSMYCYCSEECQTIHWKERKHRNECKQVQILNKYHKPYAKEIRDAVIRGDKEIPSLEKLRYKLGLTRPQEEYIEFFELTHNGKKIDPNDYLVGREDGTLWVGSVPNSPIRRNDTIIVLPTLRQWKINDR